jgi:hypothetical protein
VEGAKPMVLWLTQRITQRMLPLLLQWLDNQSNAPLRREIVHTFEQQAAKAEIKPEAAVPAEAAGETWLVRTVNVATGPEAVVLTFGADEANGARLTLTPLLLRQWLAIVHAGWVVAEWPLSHWPEWIQKEATPLERKMSLH